ncbi:hypothetical protein [Citrobacter sp. C411]|uniref:hypothetical protein n=1 Tax=Citrobacter sp. C411 TaxID=3048144 RepID=UPI0039C3F4C8
MSLYPAVLDFGVTLATTSTPVVRKITWEVSPASPVPVGAYLTISNVDRPNDYGPIYLGGGEVTMTDMTGKPVNSGTSIPIRDARGEVTFALNPMRATAGDYTMRLNVTLTIP